MEQSSVMIKPQHKTQKTHKVKASTIVAYILLILLAILCFAPFYIMIINCTESNADLASKLNWLPGNQFFENYARLSKRVNIWVGFKNSLIISFASTALAGYFGALTAYGFAKFKFKGQKVLFALVLASLMIPPQLGMLGFIKVCNVVGMMNTKWALIIPAIASANIVFFVKQYISSTVPDALIEAARIDGCGEFAIFNKIVLPIISPSVATMSIFTFISSWNSYLIPLLIFNDESKYTVPILTALAKGTYQNDFGAVDVCVAMSMLPIMIVFLFCSKYIIGGLTVGSVKE